MVHDEARGRRGGPSLYELGCMYDQGHLEGMKEPLYRFIRNNRAEIIRFKGSLSEDIGCDVSIDACAKIYLLQRKSIDTRIELEEQMKEIKKEIWIRHEEGPFPSDSDIAHQWIKKYAPIWREYYVMSLLYLFHRREADCHQILTGE